MNSFGRIFRLHVFGESHGSGIGVVIDGCRPGIGLQESDFTADLQRRKSGARGTTPRIESDIPEIVSGVYKGFTTGAPICIFFKNNNTKSSDYELFKKIPRPGHADFTAQRKYAGFADPNGGGHFSGRMTLALVAAGVVAKKMCGKITFNSDLLEAGGDRNIDVAVEKALTENNSIGGIVECRISHLPIGLGEPFFDSTESLIAHIAFAIPGVRGIEFGAGFASAAITGVQCNDVFIDRNGKTLTNNCGGINGGITNGNELVFRIAVKPTSSIGLYQKTFNFDTELMEELRISGRHDACIALRIPVIAEAIAAIVIADLLLLK